MGLFVSSTIPRGNTFAKIKGTFKTELQLYVELQLHLPSVYHEILSKVVIFVLPERRKIHKTHKTILYGTDNFC